MTVHEFRAMGTGCRVVVAGPPALAERGEQLVRWYERRWSRFLPGSELSRLNAAAGHPVVLPADTVDLVERAVTWWETTAGRFDPTVLDALESLGYDRPFADGPGPVGPSRPAPGCRGIEIDHRLGAVRLPPGVRLDLGGLAKGHAADLVAAELVACGATGALVSLGGDVAVTGMPPPPDPGWSVAVADPGGGAPLASVSLAAGGVATSSRLTRRWAGPGGEAHHLVDPATGRPADGDVLAATVVAGSAADAEVLAKVAVVAGSAEGARSVRAAGATGLLVLDGRVRRLPGLHRFAA